VGRRELYAFVERHTGRKLREASDLSDGWILASLFNRVFGRCRITLAAKETHSVSQAAAHHWHQLAKRCQTLQLPVVLFNRRWMEQNQTDKGLHVLALFYFLFHITRHHDFAAEFAFELPEALTTFLESVACIRALVVGGAMPLSAIPANLRQDVMPHNEHVLSTDPESSVEPGDDDDRRSMDTGIGDGIVPLDPTSPPLQATSSGAPQDTELLRLREQSVELLRLVANLRKEANDGKRLAEDLQLKNARIAALEEEVARTSKLQLPQASSLTTVGRLNGNGGVEPVDVPSLVHEIHAFLCDVETSGDTSLLQEAKEKLWTLLSCFHVLESRSQLQSQQGDVVELLSVKNEHIKRLESECSQLQRVKEEQAWLTHLIESEAAQRDSKWRRLCQCLRMCDQLSRGMCNADDVTIEKLVKQRQSAESDTADLVKDLEQHRPASEGDSFAIGVTKALEDLVQSTVQSRDALEAEVVHLKQQLRAAEVQIEMLKASTRSSVAKEARAIWSVQRPQTPHRLASPQLNSPNTDGQVSTAEDSPHQGRSLSVPSVQKGHTRLLAFSASPTTLSPMPSTAIH